MAIEVHFFDRSSQERVVRVLDLEWHGPFIWSPDGNFGCDCNRSLFMYDHNPARNFGCNAGSNNIIVVEKIVVEENVVYFDDGVVEGRYQPAGEKDQEDATLLLISGLLQNLEYAPQEADSDLTSILAHCRTCRDSLAKIDNSDALLEAFDGAIQAAESIERCDDQSLPGPAQALEQLQSFVGRYRELFKLREKAVPEAEILE